jgi:hypothetical protein
VKTATARTNILDCSNDRSAYDRAPTERSAISE